MPKPQPGDRVFYRFENIHHVLVSRPAVVITVGGGDDDGNELPDTTVSLQAFLNGPHDIGNTTDTGWRWPIPQAVEGEEPKGDTWTWA